MERTTLPIGTDPEQMRVQNFMFDNAMGTMIDLSNLPSAPTTANGFVKENQWGIYSGVIYFTRLGTTYKITPTAV